MGSCHFLPFYALAFGWAATWLLKSDFVANVVHGKLASPWLRMGLLALIGLALLGVDWHIIHGLYTSLGNVFVPITHYVLHRG